MKIVLATANQDKLQEIRRILGGLGIDFLTLGDFPGIPKTEETGDSLRENAILKAKSALEFTGFPSLADDSGLEVEYLKGAPGVNSARFAGPNCTYRDNNLKLLSLLGGVAWEKRKATFVCVAALALNDKEILTKEGKVSGYIADKELGGYGFGYDPLFYFPPKEKTFGQMSAYEKNQVSHRASAFSQIRDVIRRNLLTQDTGNL